MEKPIVEPSNVGIKHLLEINYHDYVTSAAHVIKCSDVHDFVNMFLKVFSRVIKIHSKIRIQYCSRILRFCIQNNNLVNYYLPQLG